MVHDRLELRSGLKRILGFRPRKLRLYEMAFIHRSASYTLPDGTKAHTKDPVSYGVSTRRGIQAARDDGKPFCLLINIADPHKPFHAEGKRGETSPDPHTPSRVFTPDEPPTPGFLFEDPVVSKELAHYYSSVRRADDGVGHILQALEESGQGLLAGHPGPAPLQRFEDHAPAAVLGPAIERADVGLLAATAPRPVFGRLSERDERLRVRVNCH